ncbi:DUF2625 family protein [Streptomyces sp. NPDC051183]|uniref:DUF2625 family protein n=1 Tax=Streptomyces sp. NPDC051183 TaxID=3155165 RepID=UPI003412D1CB
MGAGHSAWLSWILSGGLQEFYEDLRWDGWRNEVSVLNGRQGLSLYPPLWSAEARRDLLATSRRTVPMAELLGLSRDSSLQLDGVDPGLARGRAAVRSGRRGAGELDARVQVPASAVELMEHRAPTLLGLPVVATPALGESRSNRSEESRPACLHPNAISNAAAGTPFGDRAVNAEKPRTIRCGAFPQ